MVLHLSVEGSGSSPLRLNLKMGKIEVNEDQLRQAIRTSNVKGKVEIVSEGGLSLLMRK